MIYLDYASTTPVDPRVADSMQSCLTATGIFGNAGSYHGYGEAAAHAIANARAQIAAAIDATSREIIFTSGATEATNLALKGAAMLYGQTRRHIITTQTEHAATLETCQWLAKQGFRVTYLAPTVEGQITAEQLELAIQPDTFLISFLHVNNETGVIQDVAALAAIVKKHKKNQEILFHLDAAQTIGKAPLSVATAAADLVSLCAHKVYGPKGIGALYVRHRPRIRLAAQIHGGGQEQTMRSGTLATHQIVGMGTAFALAMQDDATDLIKIKKLRALFLTSLENFLSQKNNAQTKKIHFHINTAEQHASDTADKTVPHILSLRFQNCLTDAWLPALKNQLAISTASTCHTPDAGPSHVLRAMGLSRDEALSSVRISFGRFTIEDDVIRAAACIVEALPTLST